MTAKDRWTVSLSCPKCGKTGRAALWQEDGWSFSNGDQSTHIDERPHGFHEKRVKVGARGFSLDWYCDECNVKAGEKYP
jgi:Zn ribbon nucleic-acid-binding protein